MKFLRSLHRYIPGFRRLSANSMIIAGTYYGAAILTMVKYWYWGLALLALPFFVFFLLDLNREKNRRVSLAVAVAAGLAVLLGAAGGLSTGSLQAGAQSALRAGVSTQLQSKAFASPAALTAKAAAVSASPAASPAQAQYAFVSAKGSKIFHRPDCSSAKRIKPENIIGFQTREEAVAAGLAPCKVCKP